MDAEQIIAGATVVQAVAVGGALIFARSQLRELVATRRDQSRAYVVAYLNTPPEMRQFPELVVENLGTTAAYDITLKSDPPLRSSLDDKGGLSIASVGMVAQGIPMLAPGQRVTTLFDSSIERPDEWEKTYRVEVSYKDRSGATWHDVSILDLASRMNSTFFLEKGMRSLNDHLEKLVKEVNELRTGSASPLPVVVEDRATHRARVAQERAEQRAAWQARDDERQAKLKPAADAAGLPTVDESVTGEDAE